MVKIEVSNCIKLKKDQIEYFIIPEFTIVTKVYHGTISNCKPFKLNNFKI